MGNFIEVTGHGAATQAPDRIDLYVSVTAVRPEVTAALQAANASVRALGIAVREAGLADADIRTTHSSVSDEYGPDGARNGYRAGQDLTLQVADLTRLDAVLSAAVAAVGDDFRMSHLSWAIDDPSELLERARAAAFADARAKAEHLAALSGVGLGALRRVVESEGFSGPVPRFALAKSGSAGFAPEQGTSQIEVGLTVRWSLE